MSNTLATGAILPRLRLLFVFLALMPIPSHAFSEGAMIVNNFDAIYCQDGFPDLTRGPVHYDLITCGGPCAAQPAPRGFYAVRVNATEYSVNRIRVDILANGNRGASILGFAAMAISETGRSAGAWVVDEEAQEPEVLRATCDSLLEGQVIFHARAQPNRMMVSLTWNARRTNFGRIIFRVWIIQRHDLIFVLDSSPLVNPLDGSDFMSLESHFLEVIADSIESLTQASLASRQRNTLPSTSPQRVSPASRSQEIANNNQRLGATRTVGNSIIVNNQTSAAAGRPIGNTAPRNSVQQPNIGRPNIASGFPPSRVNSPSINSEVIGSLQDRIRMQSFNNQQFANTRQFVNSRLSPNVRQSGGARDDMPTGSSTETDDNEDHQQQSGTSSEVSSTVQLAPWGPSVNRHPRVNAQFTVIEQAMINRQLPVNRQSSVNQESVNRPRPSEGSAVSTNGDSNISNNLSSSRNSRLPNIPSSSVITSRLPVDRSSSNLRLSGNPSSSRSSNTNNSPMSPVTSRLPVDPSSSNNQRLSGIPSSSSISIPSISIENFEEAFLRRLTTGFDLSELDPFSDFNEEEIDLRDLFPSGRQSPINRLNLRPIDRTGVGTTIGGVNSVPMINPIFRGQGNILTLNPSNVFSQQNPNRWNGQNMGNNPGAFGFPSVQNLVNVNGGFGQGNFGPTQGPFISQWNQFINQNGGFNFNSIQNGGFSFGNQAQWNQFSPETTGFPNNLGNFGQTVNQISSIWNQFGNQNGGNFQSQSPGFINPFQFPGLNRMTTSSFNQAFQNGGIPTANTGFFPNVNQFQNGNTGFSNNGFNGQGSFASGPQAGRFNGNSLSRFPAQQQFIQAGQFGGNNIQQNQFWG